MVDEHDKIFHDLFGNKSDIFEKITHFLAGGAAEYQDIVGGIKYASSGALSKYLTGLSLANYISQDCNWSFKTGHQSKICTYRLCDNYLRFYYCYLRPKIEKIKKGQYTDVNVSNLKSWETMMGLQFENLVLNNRALIHKALNIAPEDIIGDNPYRQRKTKRTDGCQIDYLIQTKYNTLFVCEIKFSKNPISKSIIQEMKSRIDALLTPKGFTCMPVLIHVNGVADVY